MPRYFTTIRTKPATNLGKRNPWSQSMSFVGRLP